jgi:hypothetical protein
MRPGDRQRRLLLRMPARSAQARRGSAPVVGRIEQDGGLDGPWFWRGLGSVVCAGVVGGGVVGGDSAG